MFLCGALTLSLTAFLLGGPLGQGQHHEAEQHDWASEKNDAPSTWLARWNQRIDNRAVDSELVWVPPKELAPLSVNIAWIDQLIGPPSAVARTLERWRVAPVRGPPRSHEC